MSIRVNQKKECYTSHIYNTGQVDEAILKDDKCVAVFQYYILFGCRLSIYFATPCLCVTSLSIFCLIFFCCCCMRHKVKPYTIGLVFCTLVANVKFVFAFFFVEHILLKGYNGEGTLMILYLTIVFFSLIFLYNDLSYSTNNSTFKYTVLAVVTHALLRQYAIFKLKFKIRIWCIL